MAYIKRQFRTILFIVVPLAVVVFVTSTEILSEDGSDGLSTVESGPLPDPGVPRRLSCLGLHRLPRDVAGDPGERPHRRSRQDRQHGRRHAGRVPRRRHDRAVHRRPRAARRDRHRHGVPEHRLRRSSSGSGSVARCWHCSCGSAAASSPRPPTSAPTSWARSRRGSPRTTPATPPRSRTTSATTSATAPVWPRTSSSPSAWCSSRTSSSASPPSTPSGSRVTRPSAGLIFPLAMMGIGLVASMVSIFLVRARDGETDALKPINRGLNIASLIMLVGAAVVAFTYVGDPDGADVSGVGVRMFAAIIVGVILGQVASRITQYFTSSQFKPVKDIAESGPDRTRHRGALGHRERHGVRRVGRRRHRGRDPRRTRPRRRQRALRGVPGGADRHRHALDHRHRRRGGHLRSDRRQRPGHRRDGRRAQRRDRDHPRRPRHRREHHQGRHQGLRDRLGGHRCGRAVRLVPRDHRRAAARRCSAGTSKRPSTRSS